jgi:hypothetical protein
MFLELWRFVQIADFWRLTEACMTPWRIEQEDLIAQPGRRAAATLTELVALP